MKKMRDAMNYLHVMVYITTFLLGMNTTLFAQANAGKKYSFSCKETTLPTALKLVERRSGYKMLFSYEDVQNYKVTVNAVDKTIDQLMSLILENKPLSYNIKNEFITVTRIASPKLAEKRQITGKVVDENNEPLPGVTVRIANTNKGVITDVNGEFTLKIQPEHTNLEVSFVGMHLTSSLRHPKRQGGRIGAAGIAARGSAS